MLACNMVSLHSTWKCPLKLWQFALHIDSKYVSATFQFLKILELNHTFFLFFLPLCNSHVLSYLLLSTAAILYGTVLKKSCIWIGKERLLLSVFSQLSESFNLRVRWWCQEDTGETGQEGTWRASGSPASTPSQAFRAGSTWERG